jgi:PAS domain S-box-containing protein
VTELGASAADGERFTGAIFQASLDCVITMDAQGRVAGFNLAAERTFGYSRQEAIGTELAELIIPPDLREEHRRGLARYLETGEGRILDRRIELTATRADGSELPVELTVTRVPDRDPPMFIGFLRDLTERRRTESEHEALLAQAQEARLEAERSANRKSRLQAVTAALSQALTAGEVADAVMAEGLPAVGAQAGSLVMLEPGTTSLTVMRAVGYSDDVLERWGSFGLDAPVPIADAVRTGEMVVIEDVAEFRRRYPGVPGPATQPSAWAAVPLIIEGRPIGALGLTFEQAHRFNRAERAFLTVVAHHAAQALERARSYERERAARADAEAAQERLAFLAKASAVLDRSLEPETTLARIVTLAVSRLGELCVIDLLDADGRIVGATAAAHDPEIAHTLEQLRQRFPLDPAGEHPVARVLRDGRPLLVPEISDDLLVRMAESEEHLAFMRRVGYRSAIVAPLRARGRTLGAIFILRIAGERSYDQADLALAEELATRAAMALDNARLHAQLKEAERAERFLGEASKILADSLDYEETLRRVAGLAVPEVADWCAVDLVDGRGGLRRMALEHVDPDLVALAMDIERRYPPDTESPEGVAQVIRSGRSQVFPHIDEAMLRSGAEDEEHFEALRRLGLASAMIVPMGARGRALGAITFVAGPTRRRFRAEDLILGEELGRTAGVAVDNARLYRERSEIAHTLQQSLLPPQLPEVPGVEVAARYRPAGEGIDVGGDFYDLFSLDGAWGLLIGDVCGKGPEAAALTALTRYTIRAAASGREHPSQVLATLNEAILRQRDDGRFCTAIFGRLDVSPRLRLRIANGGHPPGFRRRAGGDIETLPATGDLLGVYSDPRLVDHDVELDPGDTLVFYTDGVTEAQAPDRILQSGHLAEVLAKHGDAPPAQLVELIEATAVGQREARDDIALLVLRVRDEQSPARLETRFESAVSAGPGA